MKTKLHLILILSLFTSVKTFSQTIMHSLGGTVTLVQANFKVPAFVDYVDGTQYYKDVHFDMVESGVTYFPRLILGAGNSSFSIGIPLTLGLGIANDVFTGKSGYFLSYDLPVMADYNSGLKATPESEKSFGFFLGGGFGYNHIGVSISNNSEKINTYGPLVHLGVRFSFRGSKSLTIGTFYKSGLETNKFKTLGFQVLTDF